MESLGGELLQLLLRPWPCGAGRRCRPAGRIAVVPGPVHRDGVAGDAGLGPGQQAVLADQPVDQGRLAGVGPPDDGDPDWHRPVARRLSSCRRLPMCWGSASRSARRRGRPCPRRARRRSATGSPRPSAKASRMPASPALPSALLAASITGLPRFGAGSRRTPRRSGSRPRGASITNSATSASSIASSVWARMRASRLSSVTSSKPAVSISSRSRSPSRAVAEAAVAGHARPVVDDGEPAPGQPVEQRGLADVGSADDGDREGHIGGDGDHAPMAAAAVPEPWLISAGDRGCRRIRPRSILRSRARPSAG